MEDKAAMERFRRMNNQHRWVLRVIVVPVSAALLLGSVGFAEADPTGRIFFVDAAATGPGDGSSWKSAFTDLQLALDAAAKGAVCLPTAPCEIWVAAGVYKPSKRTTADDPRSATFAMRSGVGIYGGFAGWEMNRAQRDPAVNQTILHGDLGNNDDPSFTPTSTCCTERRFEGGCDDAACQAAVCEVVGFESCAASWDSTCVRIARLLCCDLCNGPDCDNAYHVVTASDTDATAVLDSVMVTAGQANSAAGLDNRAQRGGGILIEESWATIRNCTFVGNGASGSGGGVRVSSGDPTITGCTLLRNTGGGMTVLSPGRATITDCSFIENEDRGLLYESDRAISRCRFIRNRSENLGGGLLLQSSFLFPVPPDIVDCVFVGNSAVEGGALVPSGSLTNIINCGFFGNVAERRAGAISGENVKLDSCIFSGNRGGGPSFSGSAGAIRGRSGHLDIRNCVFVGNIAGGGGAIIASGTVSVSGCVFKDNVATDGVGPDVLLSNDSIANINFSNIPGGEGMWGGAGNIDIDPRFVDADGPDDIVGTEDDNLRLLPNSPLIDAGDPTATVMLRDPDGHPRILCGRVDMGAYEFGVGDFDCNRLVNLTDFSSWPTCLTGPNAGLGKPGCEAFDFNADNDIDLDDMRAFQLLCLDP